MAKYKLAKSIDDVKKYLHGAKVISFDFETAPDKKYRSEQYAALAPHKSHIVGVSFSREINTEIYAPMVHQNYNNLNMNALLSEFANGSAVKIAHNLSFETMFLYAMKIQITAPVYDTILAAMMTLKSNTEFRSLSDSGLETLVPQLLHVDLPKFEEVVGNRCSEKISV